MRRKVLVTLFISLQLLFVGGGVFAPAVANAATAGACGRESSSFLSFPTWYKYLNPVFVGGECKIDVEIPGSAAPIGLAIFEIVLRVAGIVAVIFVIVGGFKLLTSTGSPDGTQSGIRTIVSALIGLVIAGLSTAAVNLIGGAISS